MQVEKIQSRIETYTSNLTQAVQSGSGAQFSMLMSMIAANHDLQGSSPSRSGESFELPPAQELTYPSPNELYTQEVAERLNLSVNERQQGEFAYLNSYIETGSKTPKGSRATSDALAKLALISGGAMLNEIANSQRQISQVA